MALLLKTLSYLFVFIFGIYLIICAYLYFNQDEILFYPQPISKKNVAGILQNYPSFDTLGLKMKDGNIVYSYISKDTIKSKRPIVLYFGGNAEEVSHLANYKKYFPDAIMVLVNYRGYGLSQGKPAEQTMFSDALEVYDNLVTKSKVDANNITVIGRSIGTGVATYLSSQRRVKSTVLFTPYESMIDVAQEKYSFIPIQLIIKHPFNSKEFAKQVSTPVLALIAKNDNVIPPKHAYNLLKQWKGKTNTLELDEDHISIINNEEAWLRIEKFVIEK